MELRVEDLHKTFNGTPVLRGVNLTVRSGETFVIIGGSGSGKSVFLKHLVRLLRPDRGKVFWDGEEITHLPERVMTRLRPRVGFVFQASGLLTSLSVEQNVGLGLRETRRLPPGEVRRIVEEKLALVGLEGKGALMPSELSGGMKKRVALARTLTMEPDAILLDEPTAELDPQMSNSVDRLVLDMKERLGKTFVIVTHDMIHTRRVGDRVGLLHEGRLAFVGTPSELEQTDLEVVRAFVDVRRNASDGKRQGSALPRSESEARL